MLADLVEETTNSPGTNAAAQLLGAVAGRRSFLSAFGDGASCFYAIAAGAVWEIGIGSVASGAPNILNRTTVLKNSSGTAARMNFSGTCRVWNPHPAERRAYLENDGRLPYSQVKQLRLTQLQSTVARSIPNSTATTFNWDTLGANSLGAASTAASYNSMTVAEAGVYDITASMQFANNFTGLRSASLIMNGNVTLDSDRQVATGLGIVNLHCFWRGGLAANAQLSLQVYQDSGGVLPAGGVLAANFTVMRL